MEAISHSFYHLVAANGEHISQKDTRGIPYMATTFLFHGQPTDKYLCPELCLPLRLSCPVCHKQLSLCWQCYRMS